MRAYYEADVEGGAVVLSGFLDQRDDNNNAPEVATVSASASAASAASASASSFGISSIIDGGAPSSLSGPSLSWDWYQVYNE